MASETMTRGEQMLALRRARMARSHPFFRGGFRPFFAGGAAWAVVALGLWLCTLAGALVLPTHFDPLAWHRHEMLFGFVGAVIAGFLLTAIPNWTGRLPIAGPPLAALAGLWLAGRLALLVSALAGREVLAANNRNLPIVGLVLLFGIANAADHAAAAGLIADPEAGIRAAIALVIVMISLIGGRIVPSFTRNWLVKQGAKNGLPTQPGRFDLITIGVTALAMAAWIVAPSSFTTGLLLLSAAAFQLVRLARWSGYRTAWDPLVLILHVGYLWVPAGLCLLGLSIVGETVQRSGALHALTAGAMATMILAVMSRATLGHTGRELRADRWTSAMYVLVTAGALLRVAAPVLPVDYTGALHLAGLLWGGAFLLFLAAYGPKLLRPRPDESR